MTPGGAPALDRRGQSAGGWGHGPELGASGWLEARLGLGRGDRSSRGRARLELPTLDLSRLDLSRLDLSRLDLSRFGLTRLGLGSLRGSLAGLSLRSLASRASGDGA
ncbi:MAG: hypothetical protein JNL38_14925, partial [Myxococcales bacterium]|nr:hypothetical protein [Myxococcales bacterium]